MASSTIYSAQITGTQTKYSEWVRMDRDDGAGFTIDHPDISTGYSIEASNSAEEDIVNGDAAVFDYDSITIPAKTAAEIFGVELVQFKHGWARVKLENVSGTGTPVIRASKRVE